VTDHPLLAHVDQLRRAIDELASVTDALDRAVVAIADALGSGGTVLVAGNGGSAAEAQHLASEFVGRLSADRERGALASVALTTDSSALTAIANDYGFDAIFARQVDALGRAGDALVVLSTSGGSSNLVEAVQAANAKGITTVGLLGGTTRVLHDMCDVAIAVPSTETATIQECHLAIVHVLVAQVEAHLKLV